MQRTGRTFRSNLIYERNAHNGKGNKVKEDIGGDAAG